MRWLLLAGLSLATVAFGREPDVFVSATVDRTEVVPGQQLTWSLTAYSRVEVSDVGTVRPPNFQGFWVEPTISAPPLVPAAVTIDGVRYWSYRLQARTLAATQPGVLHIGPAEVELVADALFNHRRAVRRSEPIEIRVAPLPAVASTASVGRWQVKTELEPRDAWVGSAVMLRVVIEGEGSLRALVNPPIEVPDGLVLHQPQVHETANRRVVEYPLVPQRAGRFVIPAVRLQSFDAQRHELSTSESAPIAIEVAEPERVARAASAPPSARASKTACFAVAGVSLFGAIAAGWWLSRSRPPSVAAPEPPLTAASLLVTASIAIDRPDFHRHVVEAIERALSHRLGREARGLTRDALVELDTPTRVAVATALDRCDEMRFAASDDPSRRETLEHAARAVEALLRREGDRRDHRTTSLA